MGSIPGSGRFPGEGNGNPLQYSCLENPHGQRKLEGYGLQVRKEQDMTEVTQHTKAIKVWFVQSFGFISLCLPQLWTGLHPQASLLV